MKLKRKTKECLGCQDQFITLKNYDYCQDCAINGNRYISKTNQCSECGDDSGWVKFKDSPKRPCKLCYLTKANMKLTKTEKYWNEVDLLAQEKIYQLFTNNIPLPNLKLITEPYRYEDKQEKLTGLFLHKDVDYRTLLTDLESQWDDQELPNKEVMAEEATLWYCQMLMKALITDLSDYSSYEPSLFTDLTSEN